MISGDSVHTAGLMATVLVKLELEQDTTYDGSRPEETFLDYREMSDPIFRIDDQAVEFFETQIRKERRRWKVENDGRSRRVLRYSDGVRDILGEVATLRHIQKYAKRVNLPTFKFRDEDAISLTYIPGVRGDTVLDALAANAEKRSAFAAAGAFFSKLKNDLHDVQRLPVNPAISPNKYSVREKLTRDALELVRIAPNPAMSPHNLADELDRLSSEYEALCSQPFRDANPKNCVLKLPKAIDVSRARSDRDYLASMLVSLYRDDANFFGANTFQLDFSGLQTLVPEFDDDVILHTHRSTIWLSRSVTDARRIPWSDKDVLITAFVRHFRLAVRRLFYQIVHSEGYRIRYGHDPSIFYVRILDHVARHLNKASKGNYKNIRLLTSHMLDVALSNLNQDFYEMRRGVAQRVYYDGFLEALA